MPWQCSFAPIMPNIMLAQSAKASAEVPSPSPCAVPGSIFSWRPIELRTWEMLPVDNWSGYSPLLNSSPNCGEIPSVLLIFGTECVGFQTVPDCLHRHARGSMRGICNATLFPGYHRRQSSLRGYAENPNSVHKRQHKRTKNAVECVSAEQWGPRLK